MIRLRRFIAALALCLAAVLIAAQTLPFDRAEWDERDREGRWLLYRRFDPLSAEATALLEWMKHRKEYDLLEWIALYPSRPGEDAAALLLINVKAPQWIRVAVWGLRQAGGHFASQARSRLLQDRPAQVLAWFRKYPEAAHGPAADVFRNLQAMSPPESELGDALPPLKPDEVFADLDAPAELQEFGDRKHAEPGRKYVHQVLRAIDGLVAHESLRTEERWRSKLRALTKHAHPAIRRGAFLAHTRVPLEDHPQWLLAAARDAQERTDVREAAFLAYTYGVHPGVYLTLLDTAEDAASPLWRTAVSRLGDLDHGFVLSRLEPRFRQEKDPEQRKLLDDMLARVRALDEKTEIAPARAVTLVRSMLVHAAWADLICHPLETTLVPWTLDRLRTESQRSEIRAALEKLREQGVEGDLGSQWGSVSDRVKLYAGRILAGK